MNTEKMREEFEAWAKQHYLLMECVTDLQYDEYFDPEMKYAWESWKASRESLVIDLPDDGIEDCRKEWPERGEKHGYDTFDTGYLYACKKHEEAIEAAGLKVKP